MKFFSLITVLACVVFAAAQSAIVVIDNIQTITTLSSNLNTVVTNINVVNVLFQGPKVGQGLQGIVSTVYQDMNNMDNPPPVFGNVDAVNIVNVLKTFVKVHQTLLSTIIGKHGLLSLFFFTQPVRVALVAIEAAVDEFALALIDMIPTQKDVAQGQFTSLGISLTAAINVYSS